MRGRRGNGHSVVVPVMSEARARFLYDQWQESGQNKKEFARERDVSYSAINRWFAVFKKEESEA